jgi:hypothetical protein
MLQMELADLRQDPLCPPLPFILHPEKDQDSKSAVNST